VEKFGALVHWSPRLAARFMESDDGAEAVKNRYLNGVPRAFLQSGFPEIYQYR
jgi:hypothetical protein